MLSVVRPLYSLEYKNNLEKGEVYGAKSFRTIIKGKNYSSLESSEELSMSSII